MKVKVDIDFETLFEQLNILEKVEFVKAHLCLLDANDISPYLEEMGFNIIEL